jgi:transposase
LHTWLARWEAGGLEGLVVRSHRPARCPHQLDAGVEVVVLELRRTHPGRGPRRIVHELGRRGVEVSQSAVYRALRRTEMIEDTDGTGAAGVLGG